MTSFSLQDKVVLVTGGAQGLGQAIVTELAHAGTRVIIGDIQDEKGQVLADTLQRQGFEVVSHHLDLSSAKSIQSTFTSIYKVYNQLDILINNAGTDITKPIQAITLEEWDRVVNVNLRGAFLMSKFALENMALRGSGHIVNITSTAAKRAWKNAAAYHASKWGLLGFTYALFTEARELNVKVTAVVAGGMKTPFILDRFPDVDVSTLQDPQNVARVVRFALEQPAESVVPEVMIIPMQETSWP